MRQIFFIWTVWVFLASCECSPTTHSPKQLTGNIQSDLKALLPKGNVKADIMDGVLQSPRQVKLTKKFQSAISENYDWFIEYIQTIQEGEPMPYNAKLGLTIEEYTELMSYMNNIEVISTGKEYIAIEANDDFIRFKSNGKLSTLNSLVIDLKNNIVTLGQHTLIFADTLSITTDQNGFKSRWTGYHWKSENLNNLDFDDMKDLSTLKLIQYTFTIGQLEKNGKTYMSLKGREIEDGVKVVDFELPVLF